MLINYDAYCNFFNLSCWRYGLFSPNDTSLPIGLNYVGIGLNTSFFLFKNSLVDLNYAANGKFSSLSSCFEKILAWKDFYPSSRFSNDNRLLPINDSLVPMSFIPLKSISAELKANLELLSANDDSWEGAVHSINFTFWGVIYFSTLRKTFDGGISLYFETETLYRLYLELLVTSKPFLGYLVGVS